MGAGAAISDLSASEQFFEMELGHFTKSDISKNATIFLSS